MQRQAQPRGAVVIGAVWLATLPDVLRNAGLTVDLYPGWETRSRSSGGYDAVMGIQVHHTASSGKYPANEMAYMWDNATYRPIGAIYLAPDGRVTVGAAGATNTSGRGGPLVTSRGVIPLNSGNRYLIAIEAANPGDGTPWPRAQQDAYITMVAALADAYLGGVVDQPGDVNAHFEWAPTRKNDPAGASDWATGRNMWNMNQFRADVNAALAPPPQPPPATDLEYDMIRIDLNPGTPQWVSMVLGATTITHTVDGYHAAVLERANVAQVVVDERDMEGILRSLRATNQSPFRPGLASANPTLDAMWERAKQGNFDG